MNVGPRLNRPGQSSYHQLFCTITIPWHLPSAISNIWSDQFAPYPGHVVFVIHFIFLVRLDRSSLASHRPLLAIVAWHFASDRLDGCVARSARPATREGCVRRVGLRSKMQEGDAG